MIAAWRDQQHQDDYLCFRVCVGGGGGVHRENQSMFTFIRWKDGKSSQHQPVHAEV